MDLTKKSDWDGEWLELGSTPEKSVVTDKVLHKVYSVLCQVSRFWGDDRSIEVCELGGAPGANLIALKKAIDCKVTCIDYSGVGCKMASHAFKREGLEEGHDCFCFNKDIRSDIRGEYDVVYSLGLVEHFHDPSDILGKHFALCRKGGVVIIGLPMFVGLRGLYARLFCPDVFETHNTLLMSKRRLRDCMERFSVDRAGNWGIEFVEGLTKESMWRCTRSGVVFKVLHRLFIESVGLGERVGAARIKNQFTSSYLIGWKIKQ